MPELPDGYQGVAPGRQTVAVGQGRLIGLGSVAIGPPSYTDIDIYTCGPGEQWYFGVLNVSCLVSCIQRFELLFSGTSVFDSTYDMKYSENLADVGGLLLPAGVTLTFRLYNYDTVARTITYNVTGTLQTV